MLIINVPDPCSSKIGRQSPLQNGDAGNICPKPHLEIPLTTTASIHDRITLLFVDARQMHAQAVERLEAGDIRDAAEKAWCATKRATDALILALTEEEPVTTAATSDGLDNLARRQPATRSLQGRYYSRQGQLHGACFYDGRCNQETERRIRETAAYIDDAESMAPLRP